MTCGCNIGTFQSYENLMAVCIVALLVENDAITSLYIPCQTYVCWLDEQVSSKSSIKKEASCLDSKKVLFELTNCLTIKTPKPVFLFFIPETRRSLFLL